MSKKKKVFVSVVDWDFVDGFRYRPYETPSAGSPDDRSKANQLAGFQRGVEAGWKAHEAKMETERNKQNV